MKAKNITSNLHGTMRTLLLTALMVIISAFGNMALGDELKTGEGTGTSVTAASDTYIDVATATLDITNVNDVIVIATFEVGIESGATTNNRTATFRLAADVTPTIYSNTIDRQLEKEKLGDKGIGSLVYIFDVSSKSGNVDFRLEHKTNNSYNNTTKGTIVVVALSTTTGQVHLNNDMKSITTGVAVPDANAWGTVTGLETSAVSLPVSGSIFIVASVNNELAVGTNATGEWKLQQRKGLNGIWTDIGLPISRSIGSPSDRGIASLGLMVTGLAKDDYYFQLLHRGNDQDIETLNTTLIAVALAYDDATNGGRTFPAFSIENETGVTSSSSSFNIVESATGTPSNDTDMFFYAQYNMTADDKLNAPSFEMYTTDGASFDYHSQTQQRRLSGDSDVGAGGSVGLAGGLSSGTSYTASLRHMSDGTVNLKTYDVILSGFQTDDYAAEGYWTGGTVDHLTQWNNTANWADGIIPGDTTNVTLYDKAYDPVISANADCKNLFVESGASLTVESTSSGAGSLIVAETATGDVTVQRFVTANKWNMLTPSTTTTTGQTFSDASDSDSWLTWYVESVGTTEGDAGEGWEYLTSLGNVVNVGQGYSYWPSVNETIDFIGSLQSADLSPTVAFTSGHGYNAIGNPYPCALQWDNTAAWSLNNVDAQIWIYNGSGYSNYPAATGHNIAMGQGFFMKANNTSPSVTLAASTRNHSSSTFLKSGELGYGSYENVLIVKAISNQYEDEIKVSFQDNGTDAYDDGWDGTKMFGSLEAPQLYLVSNEINYSHNHLSTLVEGEERTIAMSYIPGAGGEQTLIADFSYLSNSDVSLEDLKTGVIQNLRDNNIYNFIGSKEDAQERFLLHFAWSPDGIDEDEAMASNIDIYSYGKQIYIRSSDGAINQKANVFVYDMLGREIANTNIQGNKLEKISVDINNTYVVVKVVKDGYFKTEKVFVK